jgi:NAD(P)H-hydrate epimerase
VSRIPPRRLYSAAQSRAVDRCAIDEHGLAGPRLMARAARAAFARLLEEVPQPECLQILCGPGNNGGDGRLLAILAAGRGIPVALYEVGGAARSADAVQAAQRAAGAGLEALAYAGEALEPRGVIVDAMLGTGIRGAPRDTYAQAIRAAREAACPVLALDVPTGVDSDTGHAVGEAIVADWTVSFITAKRGLYTGAGPAHGGAVSVDDLGVPPAAFDAAGHTWDVLDLDAELQHLPARDAGAHKGRFGRCLLIGGDEGMGGAIILASEAALRTGAGLARAATRAANIPSLLARRPECMTAAIGHRNDLEAQLPWADALVIGPGLGQAPWGEQLLHAALAAGKPMIVDADALNLLAARHGGPLPPGSVVTPHPGEAARLLGVSAAEVQADRFSAALALAERLGAAVVLKGQGSLVVSGGRGWLCTAGNAGMASGGMGDVLSGVIGALLAQGLGAAPAARLGTVLHSSAADRAAALLGVSALLASDVSDALGELLP